jgi:hypothetical protein
MSRTSVSTNSADAGDGAMIWILAVIVGLALVATLGWAFIAGGIEPLRGQAGLYAPAPATGASGPLIAGGTP